MEASKHFFYKLFSCFCTGSRTLVHTMEFWFISTLFCSITIFLAEVNGKVQNCACQIDPQAHDAFCKLEEKLDKIMSALQAGK